MRRIVDKLSAATISRWTRRHEGRYIESNFGPENEYVHWALLIDGPQWKIWYHISQTEDNAAPTVEFSPYTESEIESIPLNRLFVRYLPSKLSQTMDILRICDRTIGNDTAEHDCLCWCQQVIDIIDDKYPTGSTVNDVRSSLYLLKVTSKCSHSLRLGKQEANIIV
jgi:hypothetical protein